MFNVNVVKTGSERGKTVLRFSLDTPKTEVKISTRLSERERRAAVRRAQKEHGTE